MKILFADAFPPLQLDRLRGEGHECEFAPTLTGDDLPGAIPGLDALVVRSTRVGAAALEAGDSLKLVVRAGAGTNTIDTGVPENSASTSATCRARTRWRWPS